MNINYIRGDTLILTILFKYGNLPMNITGWTVFFTAKKAVDDSDIAATTIKKDVTAHTDPVNGISTITLSAAETAAMTGPYYYDIQIKDTLARIFTPFRGELFMDKDITIRVS